MKDQCRLCQKKGDLKRSHIIPKFVYSWHREASPGYLRLGMKPNVRIQDGVKAKLLCGDCENLFSIWENEFYRNIFLPYQNNPSNKYPLQYKNWALKFCVSLSWRSLIYLYELDSSGFQENQNKNIHKCLIAWRKYLLDETRTPGIYEQHLLPLDFIEDASVGDMSPYLNRYLITTTDMDLLRSKKDIFVYTKFFRFILFGIIEISKPNNWVGMKIHVHNGGIGGVKNYKVPRPVINYINERANKCLETHNNLSPKQKRIIKDHLLKNKDKLMKSDVISAFQYDLIHSGGAAFAREDDET